MEKTREKTREKILRLISKNSEITTAEIAEQSGITLKGVEWSIGKLKKEGIIKRVGADKGGHWEVIKTNENAGINNIRALKGKIDINIDLKASRKR